MDEHDRRIIHSSEEPNWRTPPGLVEKLRAEFDFGLDAAADRESAIVGGFLGPGSDLAEDALRVSVHWHRLTTKAIFLNPPFSRKVFRATGDPSFDIREWAAKCWIEARSGATIVGVFPFAPQTEWYRSWVWGLDLTNQWNGCAAVEERRLPHRISFLRPGGGASSNAGVNSAIIIWRPDPGYVGPWSPAVRYWTYR